MFVGESDDLTAVGRGVDPINGCFGFECMARIAGQFSLTPDGREEVFNVWLVWRLVQAAGKCVDVGWCGLVGCDGIRATCGDADCFLFE